MRNTTALLALIALSTVALPLQALCAPRTLTLRQPLDGATVREVVPIRVDGLAGLGASYATVTIDGTFRAAPAIPDGTNVVYLWDTKASYATPDDPSKQLYTADGSHTLAVKVFDKDSTELGNASVRVRLANKVTSLPDGVKLLYQWKPNQVLRYTRHSSLSSVDGQGNKVPVQTADIKFERQVEDVTGSNYLVTDRVLSNGTVTNGATAYYVQSAYMLGAKSRTVNRSGETLVNETPISNGDHFGFSIPQFSPRRVNVGDSWQSHMLVTLQWASEKPTMLTGTARLDGFEWQNGYPTAKIIESYDGPARFNLGRTASLPPIDAGNIHVQRTVWFAYSSGRLIRLETSLSADASVSSGQFAALGVSSGAGQYAGGPSMEGMNPYQQPGSVTGQIMNQQEGMTPDQGGADYSGDVGGGGRPGMPVPGGGLAYGQQQQQRNSIKLEAAETIAIAGVGFDSGG